jgi:uncharacterized Zn finger protein (UPF0148 family)
MRHRNPDCPRCGASVSGSAKCPYCGYRFGSKDSIKEIIRHDTPDIDEEDLDAETREAEEEEIEDTGERYLQSRMPEIIKVTEILNRNKEIARNEKIRSEMLDRFFSELNERLEDINESISEISPGASDIKATAKFTIKITESIYKFIKNRLEEISL